MPRSTTSYFIIVCLAVVCCSFVVQTTYGMAPDEFDDPEDAMMREREGMGPDERVTIGVLHRPAECTRKVQEGSRVAVELTLSKVVPSETKAGEIDKIQVLTKKPKLIIAGSGRFIEGVENGVVGACVGEIRSLRIPASLGFSDMGSKKLNIPPETDLRAVVKIEDAEDPDPYGEDMDDMSPDEDMDEDPEGAGGQDAEDGDDDSESTTGPDIPDEEVFQHVKKIPAEQLAQQVKEKNVFVMFYAPWCGHCTAVKPKFAKVARAFRSESNVAIVAVDATEDEEISSQYGIEGFPTFLFFKKGAETPTPYNDARTATAMVNAVNRAFGTDRLPNGRLTQLAGTVAELNELVIQWQSSSITLKELEQQLPQGSYYRRVVEGMHRVGEDYVTKEKARLSKMMNEVHSVKAEQMDSIQRRLNILDVFDDERDTVQSPQ